MNLSEEIIDNEHHESFFEIETQKIISLNRFIFLSIITFGMYEVWWMYKAWKFFKQKDNIDISPIARAIFNIFFLFSLFKRILIEAENKGYNEQYDSGLLFLFYIIFSLLSRLPDYYAFISLFSIVFIIPAFKALNFIKQNSTEFETIKVNYFNDNQLVLIIFCTLIWALIAYNYLY